MPLTQIVLADAVSVIPVHVSRVTAALRKAGAMKLEGGVITIADFDELEHVSS